MPRILRRPLAASDIGEIWDYISEDSVAQADAWVDRLDAKLQTLATQPRMGRSREDLMAGLRSFPFGRYVIFYLPLDDGIDVSCACCIRRGTSTRCRSFELNPGASGSGGEAALLPRHPPSRDQAADSGSRPRRHRRRAMAGRQAQPPRFRARQ